MDNKQKKCDHNWLDDMVNRTCICDKCYLDYKEWNEEEEIKEENPSNTNNIDNKWEERFDLLWGLAPPPSLKYTKGEEIKAFIKKEKENSLISGLELAIGEEEEEFGHDHTCGTFRQEECNCGMEYWLNGYNKKREEIINIKKNQLSKNE